MTTRTIHSYTLESAQEVAKRFGLEDHEWVFQQSELPTEAMTFEPTIFEELEKVFDKELPTELRERGIYETNLK